MDKKKSQHYNFCYEVIPSLFHVQTSEFMKYIERDGLKFLEFWWNHVGGQLPFDKLVPFTSMNYELFELKPNTKIVFLTMPPPQEAGEMFFLALIANPEKRFAWVRLPTTRILVLVKRPKDQYPEGAEMGDLTPRGIFVSLGKGSAPSMGTFKKTVLDLLEPKKPA
jgi:hypothetical protein